jgi:hypothetical protein
MLVLDLVLTARHFHCALLPIERKLGEVHHAGESDSEPVREIRAGVYCY